MLAGKRREGLLPVLFTHNRFKNQRFSGCSFFKLYVLNLIRNRHSLAVRITNNLNRNLNKLRFIYFGLN